MKTLLIVVFILYPFIDLLAQSDHIDSVINNYERKYRLELNKSDTILIDEIVSKIKNGDVNLFETSVVSKTYSEAFKRELAKRLLNKGLILEKLVHSLAINVGFSDKKIYSLENNPVFDEIIGDKLHIEKIADFLYSSNYLDRCNLLLTSSSLEIGRISFILKKSKKALINSELIGVNCKNANLYILSNH